MKRIKFIFIGLFLAIFALSSLYAFSYYLSLPAPIEDIHFENAIRESLEQPEGDITISQLRGIKNFKAVDANIHSIEGIQYMTNLRTLNLEGNYIGDVRPLKDLTNLTEINLRDNEMISLESANFKELNGLKNLKHLNLRHNVKRPDKEDRTYQHRLEDISLLTMFPSLETLNLRDNHIKDPTPLSELTQLKKLDISQNPIANGDLTVLSTLTQLEELNLRETDVNDISFLTEMPDLTYLNLHSNATIRSVQPIKHLSKLETLIIPNVPLKDEINVISELDQLIRLNVRNTEITDVSALESLMKKGALQDRLAGDIEASVDISFNPIPLEKVGEKNGFFPIRKYWNNVADRTPEKLLPPKTETIYINEYMASNSKTFSDVDSNYYDWIELYNPANDTVDLDGYYLTDDPTQLTRYRLENVDIEADSTLVVFASGENSVDRSGMIHTNFSIDRQGEPIILVAPDQETIVDYFPPRELPRDVSFGRSRDDSDTLLYFNQPTPNETNHSEGSKFLLQTPRFSHSGGFYQSSFDLTFDVPDSHTVYYTDDGSSPNSQSTIYKESIKIPETIPSSSYIFPKATTIRAVSYDENNQQSDVVTHTYFVGEDVNDYFSFPVVSITTDPGHFFDEQQGLYVNENYFNRGREWERPIFLEFFEPNGVRAFRQNLGVRIHGGFTREYPQKSLRLYARSSYDQESTINYPIFKNLTAHDSGEPIDQFQRILLRNGGNDWDGAIFRDFFTQSLVSDLGTQSIQAGRPSIVFINGEYWGIHNIRERQDEYYLASHYNVDPEKVTILSGAGGWFDRGDPEGADDYHDLLTFVKEQDMSDREHYDTIEQWIDIDNFIDYYITQIYIANTDWPHNNIKMWRYNGETNEQSTFADGRWRWLLYDTDFGFSRYDVHSDHLHDTISWILDEDPTITPPETAGNFLFRNLIKNETIEQKFLSRFQNHLNITFRRDHVTAEIDRFKQLYEDEMPKQLSKWDQYGRQMDFWEYEVSRVRDFAQYRPYVIRQYLSTHFDLYDQFKVTIISSEVENGQIYIDDLPVFDKEDDLDEALPWNGDYYKDLPIKVRAEADEGYHFVGWEQEDGTYRESTTITVSEDIILTPIFESSVQSLADDFTNDIQSAKTLAILITYLFSFTTGIVIAWSFKYFTKKSNRKWINRMVILSIIFSAIILLPVVLTVLDLGFTVLLESFSIQLVVFSFTLGASLGALLPNKTKSIRTFDA